MNKISLTLSHKRLPKAKNLRQNYVFKSSYWPATPPSYNLKYKTWKDPLPLEELVQKKTCVADNYIMKTIQLFW